MSLKFNFSWKSSTWNYHGSDTVRRKGSQVWSGLWVTCEGTLMNNFEQKVCSYSHFGPIHDDRQVSDTETIPSKWHRNNGNS